MAGLGWLRAGTIAVNNGSRNVNGTDTIWGGGVVNSGDIILLPNGTLGEVESISSNTALTLKQAYTGATASAQPYAIIRMLPSGNVAADLAADLQALIQRYGITLDQLMEWLDGASVTSFSDGTTTLSGLHGLRKLMADIASKAPAASPVFTGTMWAESITWTSDKQYIGRTFGRLSAAPGQGLSGDTLAGRYGLALTYNVRPAAGGGYESIGGGQAGALAIDEGRLSWSRGTPTSDAGQPVTFTTELYVSAAGNTVLGSVADDGDKLQVSGIATAAGFRHRSYTRATVPSASAYARCTIYVSDAVGGASPAWSDGAAWTSFKTNAAI